MQLGILVMLMLTTIGAGALLVQCLERYREPDQMEFAFCARSG